MTQGRRARRRRRQQQRRGASRRTAAHTAARSRRRREGFTEYPAGGGCARRSAAPPLRAPAHACKGTRQRPPRRAHTELPPGPLSAQQHLQELPDAGTRGQGRLIGTTPRPCENSAGGPAGDWARSQRHPHTATSRADRRPGAPAPAYAIRCAAADFRSRGLWGAQAHATRSSGRSDNGHVTGVITVT